MSVSGKLALFFLVSGVVASCAHSGNERFIIQRIPIEIKKDTPVKIRVKVTGDNQVGIDCSAEFWRALTNGAVTVNTRLLSSNKEGTEVTASDTRRGYRIWGVESWHVLFHVAGDYHAEALVEITFPNAPPSATRADIVVGKIPSDFGL